MASVAEDHPQPSRPQKALGMIAYALCVHLALSTNMCMPLPAAECKDSARWYRAHGYEAECRIADQPIMSDQTLKSQYDRKIVTGNSPKATGVRLPAPKPTPSESARIVEP